MVDFLCLARVGVTDMVVGVAAEEIEASLAHPFAFLHMFPDWERREG